MSTGNTTILKQVLRDACLPALGIMFVNVEADSMENVWGHLRDTGLRLLLGAVNLERN